MSDTKFKYHYLKYNSYGVLRPSLILILILCFLCKDFFLVAIVGASSFKGAGAGSNELVTLISPILFLSDLPAIFLFYALSARRPEAGRVPRFIWKYGRLFIALSIFSYIVILFSMRDFTISKLTFLDGSAIAFKLLILIYIYTSSIIADTFGEFPIPEKDAGNGT